MQRKYANTISKVMALAMATGVVIGCTKIKCDEPAPTLTYDTLMLDDSRENLIFQTEFEDCQGDIGHDVDTDGAIDSNTIRSVRTFLYEKIDGQWVEFIPANPTSFFSVIPASSKNREGWLLKGKVIQSFSLVQLYQGNDTIRLESYIIDQAGNQSNRVQSVPYVFQNQGN